VVAVSLYIFVMSYQQTLIFYKPFVGNQLSIPSFIIPYTEPPLVLPKQEEPKQERVVGVRKTIFITNYYIGDSTGSGNATSSGLRIKDFQTNKLGWYTYKGFVVVASATYRCLNAKSGACAKFKTLPEDYDIFNIFDKVIIVYKNVEYKGMILDSCGACMFHINGEKYQRYDVFLSPTAKRFGKVLGQVIIPK
jgi:hypothetical protein